MRVYVREHVQLAFFLFLVVILICSSEDAKTILLAAENLGLSTGEFVFIIVQWLEVGADKPSVIPTVRSNK